MTEKRLYVEPNLEALRALGVPHMGIPRRDLTRDEFAERRAFVRNLSPVDRALYDSSIGQYYAMRQPRASRTSTALYLDLEIEPEWIAKAQALNLIPDGSSRRFIRRAAKRLADTATAEEIERAKAPMPLPPLDDDELVLAHLASEVGRWRAASARDLLAAKEHAKYAEVAETKLVAHMRKLGIA